ncbi:hypothetical protein AXF42_Ash004822 [Apostasia shenzhenica]|uniref:Myb/SANT-like DNA-binding domain-containing protein n=1 Tax=Apostasia shenzhenica TaxID=1088818 RepID=A0A2I0B7N6_9ASPA|nr:hypothetical protein AXF42_Ash004822 [Apostasia shenzhenica]
MGQDKLSIRKPSRTMPVDDRMTETEDETQLGPSNLRANKKSRDPNFSNEEKDRLILLITEKHNNGDVINENPMPLAWIEITTAYSSQVSTNKMAQQLKDSWKTLKKEYRSIMNLLGGVGGDGIQKPFTHYEAIGDLITNTYALGNHARSSVNYISTTESPKMDANVQVNANDFIEPIFDAKYVSGEGSSFAENYVFVEDNDVTRDPSSGSGGKRVTETSKERRRRKKSFTKDDVECLLSEARNKTNIALQAMQRAMPYTMEDAMKNFYEASGFQDGIPSFDFSKDEINIMSAPFNLSMIGKFPFGKSPLNKIRKFCGTSDLAGEPFVVPIDAKHVLVSPVKQDSKEYCRLFFPVISQSSSSLLSSSTNIPHTFVLFVFLLLFQFTFNS